MSGTNTNVPRGFKPVRQRGGQYWNGSLTPYRVASAYNTSIFTGDVVKLVTAGTIEKAAVTEQMRGVAMGFQWVGLDGVPRYSPFWPANTVTLGSVPATVMVVDDPDVMFEAVFTNSVTAPPVTAIGSNFDAFDAGGSTASGLSGQGIDFTTLATSAKPWRFEDYVQRPDNIIGAAYVRGIFSPQLHDYRVNTGI
jgi:hypothetical protein